MTTAVQVLWTITLGSWLTAAGILLVRLLFRRVLSAKAAYYLWLLLALRLMLPVLPESPMSLQNFLPESSSAVSTVTTPLETSPTDAAPQNEAPEVSAPLVPTEVQSESATIGNQADPVSELPAAASKTSSPSLFSIAFWIWLAGMGITLTVYVALYCITAWQLHHLPRCTDNDTLRVFLRLKRACDIGGNVQLASGGSGMLGGLFHPTIVVPVERHGEDVAPILLHELMHYKYKDLWIAALLRLLTVVYWFNPVVWVCFQWALTDSEAACDQRVLETGLIPREQYAGALYEEGTLHMRKGLLMQTTFRGRRHSLKRRIRRIVRFRRPKLYLTLLSVVLALGIVGCTMTDSRSASSAAPSDTVPDAQAFQQYMEPLEPPNGVFGLTFEEHVSQNLLDPDNGILESHIREDTGHTFSSFTTTMELGGETVEISYLFSQNARSDQEILTQVLVTPPSDVPIDTWLSRISDPWLSAMVQNTDFNGWEWNTQEYVADFLTEAQLDATVDALVQWSENSTASDALKTAEDAEWYLATNWHVVTAFYTEAANVWQFNGTGAALIAALHRDAAQDTSDISEPPSTIETGPSAPVLSPYTLTELEIRYDNTTWAMTPTELITAQSLDLDDDVWRLSDYGKPLLTGTAPYPDHPEVQTVCFLFDFELPYFQQCLFRTEVHYDPEQVSFETLVAQRTSELGPPEYTDESKAFWTLGNTDLTIYADRDGSHQEWLSFQHQDFDLTLVTQADLDQFLTNAQPPNGHYGWTFEEHVAAGLLDPEDGVLETNSEGIVSACFTTTIDLGGYTCDAGYYFSETMANLGSGRAVLTEVHVDPPDDIPTAQWVSRFSEPWLYRMLHYPDRNAWYVPITAGSLLTEKQRTVIAENLLARAAMDNGVTLETLEDAYAYLDQWTLAQNFYEAARGWVFNGTGIALYEAAQNSLTS